MSKSIKKRIIAFCTQETKSSAVYRNIISACFSTKELGNNNAKTMLEKPIIDAIKGLFIF